MSLAALDAGNAAGPLLDSLPTWAAPAATRAVARGSRDRWLAARRAHEQPIGEWEASVILGAELRTSAEDLWAARRDGLPLRDIRRASHRQWWRAQAISLYKHLTKNKAIATPHFLVRDPRYPWAVASPHGIARDEDGAVGLLLVHIGSHRLTPSDWGAPPTCDDGGDQALPAAAYWAGQWCCETADVQWVEHLHIAPDQDGLPLLHVHRELADLDAAARQLELVKAWRWRHLVEGEDPADVLFDMGTRGRGIREATPAEELVIAAYRQASREEKASAAMFSSRRIELAGRLRESALDTAALLLANGDRVTLGYRREITWIDEETLRELAPKTAMYAVRRGPQRPVINVYPTARRR